MSRATSSKKMLGLLPPSSSVTGMRFCAALCMMRRPVPVSPVKAILRIRVCAARGMSAAVPRATSVKGWPITGVVSSKYAPSIGSTNCPPM